jgi:hypothetical protein
MALQDIRELNGTAEIGAFYLVPCVKIKDEHPLGIPNLKLAYQGLWMPVVGGIHEDPELKTAEAHIHPDWRFVPETVIKRLNRVMRQQHAAAIIAERDIENPTLILKRRKKFREFTFPHVDQVCEILEPIYVNKQTGCATCPHRGVSLAGLKPDERGNVICPGHGLKVHQQTGLVVRRG